MKKRSKMYIANLRGQNIFSLPGNCAELLTVRAGSVTVKTVYVYCMCVMLAQQSLKTSYIRSCILSVSCIAAMSSKNMYFSLEIVNIDFSI